jgi:hypothetical protein
MADPFDHPVPATEPNIAAYVSLVFGVLSALAFLVGGFGGCFCSCCGGMLGMPFMVLAVVVVGLVSLIGIGSGLFAYRHAQSSGGDVTLPLIGLGMSTAVFLGISAEGLLACAYFGLGMMAMFSR